MNTPNTPEMRAVAPQREDLSSAPQERPDRHLFDSTTEWRINSTADKINRAFNAARIEARDEALWLSSICRGILRDNDRLRIEAEGLRAENARLIERLARATGKAAS